MYFICGFRIVVIKGDREFTSISDLVVGLPMQPRLVWSAASEHCGLIEQNICFLKEMVRSLCRSLHFERVPGIMVVYMVLHIVKFINEFPRKGEMKHFSPREIMTNRRLHVNNLHLTFGSYYAQVAKNVEPCNSHAPRMRAAILLGSSENLAWQAARYSLLWILVTLLPGTNG